MTSRRTLAMLCALPVLGLAQAAGLLASAHAQTAVLRVDPAAEALCAAVEQQLTDAQLVRDPGYFAEARSLGLAPAADATLEVITPLLGLRLAVVPLSADDHKVNVDFRDGRSGASLGMVGIPLENGLFGELGRSALRREVFQRLGGAPPAQPPAAEGDELGGEVGGEVADDASAPSESSMSVDAAIGFGVGTRELEWPADGQAQRVETGMFAAYELAARFAWRLSESVELGPELVYQSSLSHELEETHTAAPKETVGVRSHRFAGLLALTFRLGDSGTFSIAPALGYGARSLRPDVHHLLTPSYSLAGPIIRLAIGIGFGENVSLSLAPEAQLIVVGDELEEEGIDPSGIALGGEAELRVSVSQAVAIGLTFRQSHALLTAGAGSATDVERFITMRLRWTP
jgi:hypothetical protein